MRVLVVHDTRAMRMIVTRALHHMEGIDNVIQAGSAEEAIEFLQTVSVDLVLCDWNLGGMTGIELLEALRTAGWTVPFGFITAESDPRFRERAANAGAQFLLSKPFTEEELANAVALLTEGELHLDELLVWSRSTEWSETDGESQQQPRARDLEELLFKLCDTEVKVTPATDGPQRRSPRYVARYLDEQQELSALCVLATPLGLAASSSLTRWSPKVTQEWARTGIIPEELLDDLGEVANVLAQFVRTDGRHVILQGIEGYAPGEEFASKELLESAQTIEHFHVDVVKYCGGCCTVVAL